VLCGEAHLDAEFISSTDNNEDKYGASEKSHSGDKDSEGSEDEDVDEREYAHNFDFEVHIIYLLNCLLTTFTCD
jgi:hypothetical protein